MLTNAKEELIEHIGNQPVDFIKIWHDSTDTIAGTLEEVLPKLDFLYNSGYGGQELYGIIWYTDGTWSERGEYDGSEWWEYKSPPNKEKDVCY